MNIISEFPLMVKNLAESELINTSDVVAKLKSEFWDDEIQAQIAKLSHRNTDAYIADSEYKEAQEMALFVEARHKLINKIILEEKQGLRINQVVEIGSGLSSRSIELSDSFDQYLDTDLKGNIKIRQEINSLKENNKTEVIELDVFNSDQADEIADKIGEKPVFLVAEGVFTYFTKDQLDVAFANIKKILNGGGEVIFDIATRKGLDADRADWSKISKDLLNNFYKSSGVNREDLAFSDLKEAIQYFSDMGFIVSVKKLQEGITDEELKKYNISDALKASILNSPSIIIARINN